MSISIKNRILSILLPVLVAIPFALQSQKVAFSASGGFYDTPFFLTLSCTDESLTIHFTTNGNTPTANDLTYNSPLFLNESLHSRSNIFTIPNCPENDWFLPDSIQRCIIIRAAAFDKSGHRRSEVTTNTYFIKSIGCDTHGLPAVSLCADSLDLFDYERGIFVPGATFDPSNPGETGNYYQSGREWERPMNIEFYELDNTGINQAAGLRTHGGNGRGIQQKCMKIYAREEYGQKRFQHKFFETLQIESFKHLILKPLTATWFRAGANNHICNQLASRLDLESLASRPVSLYLNGEYWGIYFIHERPDEHYLEEHGLADKDDVNLIEGWLGNCEVGSNNGFLDLYDFIAGNDLADSNNYSYIARCIDIGNFIDYQIFEIYTANLDWPANNMRCWQEGDGPWRWIFYDGDLGLIRKEFDGFANATYDGPSAYPSSSQSTLFFRKLLKNETFKVAFVNRFNQLMHTAFAYESTKAIHDEVFAALQGEIPNQVARFGNPESQVIWEGHMAAIDEFLSQRANYVFEQLTDYYLFDDFGITINAVYPSPTQSEIQVRVKSNKTALAVIQVFDMSGRLRFATNHAFGTDEMEVSFPIHLPSGIYILRIGETAKKFVVSN